MERGEPGRHDRGLYKAMRRNVMACAWVGLALLLLYQWQFVMGCVVRVYSELLPGGLQVSYYRGIDFREKANRRTERAVCRDYGKARPAWNVSRYGYSSRWEGVLHVPKDADYEFYLQSKDGSRLYIDGESIVDRWQERRWASGSHGRKFLGAGTHSIRLEHYSEDGESALRLRWCGGPIPPNTVLGVPYITKK